MPTPSIPATPGSGPNAPHANAGEDDPSKFFGEDEDNDQEPSLMPEEEGAADVEIDEPGDEPDDEPVVARPPVPATGEALPGQQFSEDGEQQREVGATAEVVEPEPEAEAEPQPEEKVEEKVEEAAPTSASSEAPGEAAGAESAAAEKAGAAAGEGEKEPPATTAATQAKNGPRGYVVVRELELTGQFLEHFQKELEEGKEPRKVYMVLEPKVEARNPAPVLTAAFKKHYKRLGQPLRLAAIPLSMWNVKSLSIKPKVIDENIAIED